MFDNFLPYLLLRHVRSSPYVCQQTKHPLEKCYTENFMGAPAFLILSLPDWLLRAPLQPVQLYRANSLKKLTLQSLTPKALLTLCCADKKWIPCLNLSLFRPVWNLVYENKWHLCNVHQSSQVQVSWTEKKDKNFKGDNRISAGSTNTFQEQSWLQDRFKKTIFHA